ncbi:GNAT family N-acetyltransferase [Paenibacillus sp. NPDC058071]|uniref:GNAT family N-acetyltransferase n=1 Tax=Paenibacillus sp. NPDC058071 TaxID=3346326 RepID=UPI0036DD4C6E
MDTNPSPLLLNIPEKFESERLIIRASEHGDGAALNEAVHESVEQLRSWMPWAQSLPTVQESEMYARRGRVEYLERTDMGLLLFGKTDGRLIGSSGLHRIDWKARKFEIGYWVRTSYAGQGYITEAVDAITHFAIRELQAMRVEIRCDARNLRSARVAERCGFTLEGVLRKERIDAIDGTPTDTMVFAKVRGEEF